MTVDEDRVRLRGRLEELVGVSGADILLDRPPGGWGDRATKSDLELRFTTSEARMDQKLEALDHRMELRFAPVDARFDAVDHRFERFEHQLLAEVDGRLRSQTWVTISTIVAVGGVMVAALRL